jgi:hypothetical protein
MSFIPLVGPQDARDEAAAVFRDIMEVRHTRVIADPYRALAHAPRLLELTWARMRALTEGGELSPKVKKAIFYTVARLNGCPG